MERREFLMATAAVLSLGSLAACATPHTPQAKAETRSEIETAVPPTLDALYKEAPGSSELANKAAGMLVFPSVTRAGIGLGGQFGRGVLRNAGKSADYYEMRGGSLGAQLGYESRSVVILFMTQEALKQFRDSTGWTVGADASVAIPDKGAAGTINSSTAQQQVVGFVFGNKGLMFSAALDGTKVTRIDLA